MMYKNPAGQVYYFPEQLTKAQAIKRMELEEQKMKQDREEYAEQAQNLFDEMFGG